MTKYYFDEEAADRAVGFIEHYITHVKGEWMRQPMILEDWQKDEIIRPLFGWKRKSDDLRKHQTAYIEIPRKNTKSTMAAFIGLLLLLSDKEGAPEIYAAAGDKKQADIVFNIASQMVEQSPALSNRVEVLKKSLFVPSSYGTFQSITSAPDTKFGSNPSGIIVDELHIHKNRELLDSLSSGTGSRRQPLTIIITTAGIRGKGNVGWEEHLYATKVKDGTLTDETYLSVIHCADEKPDDKGIEYYFLKSTIKKANPNYPISPKADFFEKEIQRVRNAPINLNSYLRFHLNIWTSSEKGFIPPDVWDACNLGKLTEKDFYHKDVIAALDLSNKKDFTAFGILNPETYEFLPYFWIPKLNLQNRNMRRQIEGWVQAGYAEVTDGNVIDYKAIIHKIRELSSKMNFIEIAYDPWNKTEVVVELEEEEVNMVEFRQGWVTMSPAIKELEQAVLTKKLNHGGNPVLKWMNSNVTLKEDPAGNIKLDKAKSTEKIDGMIVLTMCVGRAVFGNWRELIVKSIYEEEGDVSV